MKSILYIILSIFLAFVSCQEELIEQKSVEGEDGTAVVNFALNMPDFQVVTRADEPEFDNLTLLMFDSEDKFLSQTVVEDYSGAGNYSANVLKTAKNIHFILSKGASPVLPEAGHMESEVLHQVGTTNRVAWGTSTFDDLAATTTTISMLRNFAKVSVEVDQAVKGFVFAGCVLGSIAAKGTLAPTVRHTLTLPEGVAYSNQVEDNLSSEQYMFEASGDKATFLIVKNSQDSKYYKIQFIDSQKVPYLIERNSWFKVKIAGFVSGSGLGSYKLEDAFNSLPANNIYAEVIKESPVIADGSGKSLTIQGKMVHLLTGTGGSVTIKSIMTGGNDCDTKASIISDEGILSGLTTVSDGQFSVTVGQVTSGQKKAEVLVYNGDLSRVVTIISSQIYSFGSNGSFDYANSSDVYNLNFNVPESFPAALLPIECVIKTDNLYPSENKNLLVTQENGTYTYTYLADVTGNHQLVFKPNKGWGSETLVMSNPYFSDLTVQVTGPDKPEKFPEPEVSEELLKIDTLNFFYNGNVIGDGCVSFDGVFYYWANATDFLRMNTDSKSNLLVVANGNSSGRNYSLKPSYAVNLNKDNYVYVKVKMDKLKGSTQIFYAKFSISDVVGTTVNLHLSTTDEDGYWN